MFNKKRFSQQQTNNKQYGDTATRTNQSLRTCRYFHSFTTIDSRLDLLLSFLAQTCPRKQAHSDSSGYIGEKFNHFLPNSIGIKPIIEYLVSTPDLLWWAMLIFTLVEGVVGLLYMLGFFTRLMSIGVFSLAFGILLGSGWLGTTCLDEWQIGILGVAAGFTIFLSGGGKYSLDHLFQSKLSKKKWLVWLTSGELPLPIKQFSKVAITGAILLFILTLYTNQEFHNGVWGPLHNKSVKPKLEISNADIHNDALNFKVYRIEGADVYGSFLIGITLKDSRGKTILQKMEKNFPDSLLPELKMTI